jgi:hypothetical protein
MEVCLKDGFDHPTSILIAGNSGSGKSFLVANLIRVKKICPKADKIYWFYKQYQPLYDSLLNDKYPITFIEGLPDEIVKPGFFDKTLINYCIIDDLHLDPGTGKHVAQLFCNIGRHNNTTVIYITQNLFFKHPAGRDIRLNAKILICFKNPQDRLQLNTIGRQIYPTKMAFFQSAVDECLKRKYGYVCLNLSQNIDDKYRIQTAIFGENEFGFPEVFIPAH